MTTDDAGPDTTPEPKRISDFMAERWEELTDEEVRMHMIALAKAYLRRVGPERAFVDFSAFARVVEKLLPDEVPS